MTDRREAILTRLFDLIGDIDGVASVARNRDDASEAIRGGTITVHGVSAREVARLMQRFPEIKLLIAGKDVSLTPERVIEVVPDALSAIIAAGCGAAGDADHEAAASRLSLEEQADLVSAILRLTMPSGVGPLVAKVTGLLGDLGARSAAGSKAPDTRSPKASKR